MSLSLRFGGLCPAAAGQHLGSILIFITALQLTAPPKDLAAYQMTGNEKQVPVYTTVSNT
jgi:hypothetical protein